jgi:hypothetical protein
MIGLIISGILTVGGAGTWVYFYGDHALDRVLDFQKRMKAGYYRKSKVNERCKACGHKHGTIVWNSELERLMHECQVCGATWPELPRVPSHLWDILGKMIKFQNENAQDVKEAFARANKPIEIKPSAGVN